jgi:preprotein translocase subunit SecF
MEFFKTPNFDYIKYHKLFFALSGLLAAATVVGVVVRGPSLMSIDFTGGTLVQGYFQKAGEPAAGAEGQNVEISLDRVRAALATAGLAGAELQSVPNHNAIILRFKSGAGEAKTELAGKVTEAFARAFEGFSFTTERVEFVGPVVGKQMVSKAILAVFFSMLGIVVYVAFRFRNWIWGVSGVFALVHDVFLALGFMALTGREISITVVAALLTLAGYSINDTIVIFDRIRENIRLRGRHSKEPLDVLINRSCNETLSRTIITSLTVFIVLLSLLFLGGEVIRDFSLALTFGVIVGSYSTIFIATPMVYLWQRKRNKPLH